MRHLSLLRRYHDNNKCDRRKSWSQIDMGQIKIVVSTSAPAPSKIRESPAADLRRGVDGAPEPPPTTRLCYMGWRSVEVTTMPQLRPTRSDDEDGRRCGWPREKRLYTHDSGVIVYVRETRSDPGRFRVGQASSVGREGGSTRVSRAGPLRRGDTRPGLKGIHGYPCAGSVIIWVRQRGRVAGCVRKEGPRRLVEIMNIHGIGGHNTWKIFSCNKSTAPKKYYEEKVGNGRRAISLVPN
ncbi:hypothetical protein GEV33_011858 [Tenebrio molitor]|uniref:Uncharacterized protein n=1 Tax=Tenebrio molitor TaxID=7067 RepID=A0A8J6L7Q0_TENMO|nr:hypothetical protein GEV33_011858 [Tenebrio molitor]